MALDRLLREVEAVADLSVDEALRDELEDFDLARRREMLTFGRGGTGRELDLPGRLRAASGDRLETARMLAITRQDFLTLRCVHVAGIGAPETSL